MRKHVLTLFIVMLFVLPTTLSFVTNPGGSNFQNVTELVKDPVLSYDEKETKHLACGGSVDTDLYIDGDYWDTWVDDASYLSAYPINYTGIHLVFNITESRPIGELNFFLRWQVTIDDPGDQPMPVYWMIYNFDTSSYDTVYYEILGESRSWEDREETITYDENYVNATNHILFYAYGSNIYVDEIEVDYAYLTVTKRYDGEFRESLPDDVLYYPDPIEHTACDGAADSDPFITGDYWDTWEDDAYHLIADSSYSVGIYLIFNITEYASFIVDDATLNIFLRWQVVLAGGGDVPELYWKLYNFDTSSYDTVYSMILSTTLNFEDREESIIYDDKYVNATNHAQLFVYSNSTYCDSITVDYAYITATNNYTESFADVSEWTVNSGNGHFSTDGDAISLFTPPDSTYTWQYNNASNVSSYAGSYYEIRYKRNTTNSAYVFTLAAYKENAMGGGVAWQVAFPSGTDDWVTEKGYISDSDPVESLALGVKTTSATHWFMVQVDYFRIGSFNEMGWQNDGSNLQGVSAGVNMTVTSDGDKITFNETVNAQTCSMWIDDTATHASLSFDHYQFLEVSISDVIDGNSDNDVWYLRVYDSVGAYYLLSGYSAAEGVFRWNIKATGIDDVKQIKWWLHEPQDSFSLDYAKIYSIANYTVTESSTTSDDYLYVEAGVLYSNMDNGSIILEYDPTFLLTGSYTWTKSFTLGDSYLSYLHGGWTDYSNETTGNLYAGTTTGLRIKFNDTANIQTIEYSVRQAQWVLIGTAIMHFDMPNWWVIATAGAVFYIPLGTYTLEFLLMIMGAVMIPFSTLFLVIGGRREMDRDKIYFFLLMFLIGWALFLGGIL